MSHVPPSFLLIKMKIFQKKPRLLKSFKHLKTLFCVVCKIFKRFQTFSNGNRLKKAKNLGFGIFYPKPRFYFFHVNIFNLICFIILQIFPLSFRLYTAVFRLLSVFSLINSAFPIFVFCLKDYNNFM